MYVQNKSQSKQNKRQSLSQTQNKMICNRKKQMINDGTYEFGDPTVMWLRMPPNSWVMVTKGGVVDKSRAFAPTYP